MSIEECEELYKDGCITLHDADSEELTVKEEE